MYHVELLAPAAQKITAPSQDTPYAHRVAVLWQHAPRLVVSVFVTYILPDWHSTEPTVVFLFVRRMVAEWDCATLTSAVRLVISKNAPACTIYVGSVGR